MQKCRDYHDLQEIFMGRSLLAGFFLMVYILLGAAPVNAHCPLCTGATIMGVAIAERYGIDSAITGLWVGAFVISTTLWLDRVLKKKGIEYSGQSIILSFVAMALTVVPFYFAGIFANPVKILGIDRLLFGMLAGSAITFAGTELSQWIRQVRGKVLFPFQTMLVVLALISFTSAMFWYLIRNTGVLG